MTTEFQPSPDSSVEALLAASQDQRERRLAGRYAPIIRFDAHEPFLPLAVGYTIVQDDRPSPSFPRRIELAPPGLPPARLAIEYALWWDWDIQHLYELEHIWVFVDAQGRVVRGEASWHGGYQSMAQDGRLALEGDHLVAYAEPGKHAFAPDPAWFRQRRPARDVQQQTRKLAGALGVLVTRQFGTDLAPLRRPYANTLVRTYLRRQAFDPAGSFSRDFAVTEAHLAPWPALAAWIPGRVQGRLDQLAGQLAPHELSYLRIAHRGASGPAPENALAAIRRAASLGADAVALDVQVPADGVPVVVYDGAATASTLAQVKGLDAGQGETLPTLDEALRCCLQERLGLYVQLPSAAAVAPVVQAIQRYRFQGGTIVGSSEVAALAAARSLDAAVQTSLQLRASDADPLPLAQAARADYVHPSWASEGDEPHGLPAAAWVARMRQAGLGILLGPEARPAELAHLKRLGVDGIASPAPELLL